MPKTPRLKKAKRGQSFDEKQQRSPQRRKAVKVSGPSDVQVDFEILLAELSASFISLRPCDTDVTIEHGLKRLVEWLGVDRATFGEVSPDGTFLSMTHCYALQGVPAFPATPVLRQFPWLAKTLRHGDVAMFSRPEDLPHEATMEREYCRRQGLKAYLSIPIFVDASEIFAISICSFQSECAWSQTDIRRVRLIGDMCAHAMARKNIEEKIRNDEKRLREFLETTSVVPWESDAESLWITYVAPQAESLLGYPIEQWFEQGFWEKRLHPDDRKLTLEKSRRLALRQSGYELEYRMVTASGGIAWVQDLVSVVRTAGRPTVLRRFMVDITRRKDAEQKLLEEKQFSESVIESLPGNFFMLDERGHFVRWNRNLETTHGYTGQELQRMQLVDWVQPEDQSYVREAVERAWSRGSFSTEYVARTKGGRRIPTYAQAVRLAIRDRVWLIGVEMDMTERKLAEETLRKSEEDFRRMADTAPVMIWRSTSDKLCDFVNQAWLNFTGRTMKQELGNGWLASVHTDDAERCLRTYVCAFDAREKFQMEYRLKRFDGQFHWILDRGVPRFETGGAFVGYIGSAVDISERKEREGTLRDLSARLITTQEEERRRIARELHDDINQRLALAATELEHFFGELIGNVPGLAFRAQDIINKINQISGGVHALSLALHPAKLEHLGLKAALRGLCRELSQQKNCEIRFSQDQHEISVSPDVALCLYRVSQEALQNVLKHSGVRTADVRITGRSRQTELVIEDAGKGFDPVSVQTQGGLGLVSMRERLRLVGGELVIQSSFSGTKVKAIVPIRAHRSIAEEATVLLQER